MVGRWVIACTALVCLIACGTSDSAGSDPEQKAAPAADSEPKPAAGDDPAALAKKLEEKPWEVVSNKGETFLPNVFYADAAENEQIMPYALDGHVQIDRLVYPTLGNPNLYVKDDPTDELVVVLRIEEQAYRDLGAKIEPPAGPGLSRVVLENDVANGFGFFLVARRGRDPNTASTTPISSGAGTDVVRVYPHEILMSPEPDDMPAVLKKRKTLRFVFKQGAMAKVPAGLYDVRFELRKNGELHAPAGAAAPVFEYQYNAVRVFDTAPDEYNVMNITDTQVSVGASYDASTKDKLAELVHFVNTSPDPVVRSAQFITFNGDLHNGGSPGSIRQKTVAWTYNEEAKVIVDMLKLLPLPIFLTAGNHDGYVSTGHVPAAVKTIDTTLGTSLEEVVADARPKAWPGFAWSDFKRYLEETSKADRLGGVHRDIFTGGFARTAKHEGFAGWKEIPREDRNYILYDGFNQWQKTYGPLYYSWKFGKSFYVSLNSFELRQHRRSGWGMYTVNYGGGMSDVQMAWLDRELLRARADQSDVVVLAHHDPRGGHKGEDFGYFFEQLEYRSVYQSAFNYLDTYWNPAICKLPPWAMSDAQEEKCLHDGLQEWMRPDPELDCAWDERKPDFTCDPAKATVPFSSGIELMKRLSENESVRTLLLGHTHYNALEILQPGDELLPGKFPVDAESAQKFATFEVQNPLRGWSREQADHVPVADYDAKQLAIGPLEKSFAGFVDGYDRAVGGWQRTLSNSAGPRELVILRLVSASDLADQTYSTNKSAYGFTMLYLTKKTDDRKIAHAQVNRATFFANTGSATFTTVGTIDIDRKARLKAHDAANPVEKLFDW